MLMLLPPMVAFPAYLVSKGRKGTESPFLMFIHIPTMIAMYAGPFLGVFPNDLGPFLFMFGFIILLSALLPYLKVFIIDRFFEKPKATTYVTICVSIAASGIVMARVST